MNHSCEKFCTCIGSGGLLQNFTSRIQFVGDSRYQAKKRLPPGIFSLQVSVTLNYRAFAGIFEHLIAAKWLPGEPYRCSALISALKSPVNGFKIRFTENAAPKIPANVTILEKTGTCPPNQTCSPRQSCLPKQTCPPQNIAALISFFPGHCNSSACDHNNPSSRQLAVSLACTADL